MTDSASRVIDSAFGAAAISLSIAAFRWCRVPTCVDVRREETLCHSARSAVIAPTAGSASATASELTAASGAGNHRHERLPNTRICADIKRKAAAAAASAAAA